MVATERMKRAETEDELKEARLEQEALRSALRLVEGENSNLREASQTVAMKSPIISPPRRDSDIPFPASPEPEPRPHTALPVLGSETEPHLLPPDASTDSSATPTGALPSHDIPPRPSPPRSPMPRSASAPTLPSLYDNEEPSPWADVPSDLSSATPRSSLFSAAAVYTLR